MNKLYTLFHDEYLMKVDLGDFRLIDNYDFCETNEKTRGAWERSEVTLWQN